MVKIELLQLYEEFASLASSDAREAGEMGGDAAGADQLGVPVQSAAAGAVLSEEERALQRAAARAAVAKKAESRKQKEVVRSLSAPRKAEAVKPKPAAAPAAPKAGRAARCTRLPRGRQPAAPPRPRGAQIQTWAMRAPR